MNLKVSVMTARTMAAAAALTGISLLCGCGRDEWRGPERTPAGGQEEDCGLVRIALTKSSAEQNGVVPNTGKEGTVNTLQLLLFKTGGSGIPALSYRKWCSAREIASLSSGVTVSDVSPGTYIIEALANGPDMGGVTTIQEYANTMVTLEGNNDPSSGFVMNTITPPTITVTKGDTAAASLILSHIAARVALSKVTVALEGGYGGGQVTLKNAFLTNVINKTGVLTTYSNTSWINREGRSDTTATLVKEHVIDGATYPSACPELLFRNIDTTFSDGASYTGCAVRPMYVYNNGSSVTPSGFVSEYPAGGQRTCLVVTAVMNGVTYYYPVVLDSGFSRNTAYDVQLTITGPGSDDPNKPVTKGNMSFSVTMKAWGTTHTYTDDI